MPLDRTAYYADSSTPLALATITANMADAEADQIGDREIQTYKWNNAAQRIAGIGMSQGDLGIQLDTGVRYEYDGSAWVELYRSALVPQTPTSLAITGTSATIAGPGLINFTSLTALAINQVFDSSYHAFHVIAVCSGSAATLTMNLRDGSTNITTLYDRSYNRARNATVDSATQAAQGNWVLQSFANTLHAHKIDIYNPNDASPTMAFSSDGSHANPAVQNTANGLETQFHTHEDSTAYDGFRFLWSAAQSGFVRIYAYA